MDVFDERENGAEYNPDPEREILLGVTSEVLDDVFGQKPAHNRIEPIDNSTFDPDAGPDWVTYRRNPDAVREKLLRKREGDTSDAAAASAVATDGGEPSSV